MHYHVNRAADVLSKNLQPAVAHNLGYRERSPSKRIEKFMRDLYIPSRNIFLITRTLEQRLALLPARRQLPVFSLPRGLSRLLPKAVNARASPLTASDSTRAKSVRSRTASFGISRAA